MHFKYKLPEFEMKNTRKYEAQAGTRKTSNDAHQKSKEGDHDRDEESTCQ